MSKELGPSTGPPITHSNVHRVITGVSRSKTGRERFSEWSQLLRGRYADVVPFDMTHAATNEPNLRWQLSLQEATEEQPEAIIATCTELERLARGVAVDRHITRFTVDANDAMVVDLRAEIQDRPAEADGELPQRWTGTEFETATGDERNGIINYLGGVIRHVIELGER